VPWEADGSNLTILILEMKTTNMLILINPSHSSEKTEKMAAALRADRFILIDDDLDFADHLALILEKRKQKVIIMQHLEGLNQLFCNVGHSSYRIAVECYGVKLGIAR